MAKHMLAILFPVDQRLTKQALCHSHVEHECQLLLQIFKNTIQRQKFGSRFLPVVEDCGYAYPNSKIGRV